MILIRLQLYRPQTSFDDVLADVLGIVPGMGWLWLVLVLVFVLLFLVMLGLLLLESGGLLFDDFREDDFWLVFVLWGEG